MYRVEMVMPNGNVVKMPSDTNLGLFEACHRAELYKARAGYNTYRVINNDNEDLEMEV